MIERKFLYVEGPDDYHVLCNLFGYYALPEGFRIEQKGGISTIIKNLDVYLEQSDLKCLGIVVDADLDLNARWQSICYQLHKFGYQTVPNQPEIQGTIIKEQGLPIFGTWLMPNNQIPGILENFIAYLIPPSDNLWQRATQAVDNIPADEQRFPGQYRKKAHIHTWLAWQEEPGKPLGQAITARYLNPNVHEAQLFVNWVRNLFEI